MKHFWNETGNHAISFFPKMSLDPATGAHLIGFTRYEYEGDPNTRYVLVAEADGPVRTAFLQVGPPSKGYGFTNEASADGRYLLRGLGDTWDGPLTDPVVEGIIAGRVGEPHPNAVRKVQAEPGLHSNWSVSARWLIQRKGIRTPRRPPKPARQQRPGFSASASTRSAPAPLPIESPRSGNNRSVGRDRRPWLLPNPSTWPPPSDIF